MTSATQSISGGRGLELSRIGEITFDLVKRQFVVDYGLAVGLRFLPAVLSVILLQSTANANSPVGANPLARIFGPWAILVGLLSFVCTLLIYASLSWGAVEQLQGRAPTAGAKLSAAVRALPVLIGAGILGYFGLVFATVLLVAPGVILALVWALVVPVATVERLGVFATFGRSAALTKGHRWSLFLIFLVFFLGSFLLSAVGTVIIRAVFGFSGSILAVPAVGPVVYATLVFNLLLGGLLYLVAAAGVGVIYYELRGLKGGFDTRALGEVFA